LGPQAVAVEMSTVSPGWCQRLAAAVEAKGASFLDAPVIGSLPQAEAGQLIMAVGGPAATVEGAHAVLSAMAGKTLHVGAQGQGVVLKLAANALLAIQVSAIAETLNTLRKAGIALDSAMNLIGDLPIMSPAGKGFGALMVADDHAPRFTAALISKDLRYAVANAKDMGAATPVLETALNVFEDLCDKGYDDSNISAVIKCFEE
ncbi:NAD(P)-dependent oxidoreductase, partial [Thioclava sp. BHET1]